MTTLITEYYLIASSNGVLAFSPLCITVCLDGMHILMLPSIALIAVVCKLYKLYFKIKHVAASLYKFNLTRLTLACLPK
uniref:Uncharacterized protein n=1 Tax=Anguilla anguilla TaxID=7936 RepID=A0A0E9WXS2_ANGAN